MALYVTWIFISRIRRGESKPKSFLRWLRDLFDVASGVGSGDRAIGSAQGLPRLIDGDGGLRFAQRHPTQAPGGLGQQGRMR